MSEDYQEIKLEKFREVICFSVLFLTFFAGKFYRTNEIFGWTKIQQQKIKYRETYFDDGWSYMTYWGNWKYKWITI